MEHPHTLLDLVLKQHYNNRQEILDKAKKILEDYHNNIINYQQVSINNNKQILLLIIYIIVLYRR